MGEQRVFVHSQGFALECMVDECPGQQAVVVTHPHPLFGGTMDNDVVESVVRGYKEKGYTTMRFNFRGVGRSEGTYDEGLGEQEDVRSALLYLRDRGMDVLDLAGYSFGAWVNARGLNRLPEVHRMVMVSPPVNFVDFSFLGFDPRIRLVIGGSEDDIAPPDMIRAMLPTWNPEGRLEVIRGADHFYPGRTGEITEIIGRFLAH